MTNEKAILMYNLLKDIFFYAKNFKGGKFSDLMPVYPFPLRKSLVSSGKITFVSTTTNQSIQRVGELSLYCKEQSKVEFYNTLHISISTYDEERKLSFENVQNEILSIPRFILCVYGITDKLNLTKDQSSLLNKYVGSVLSQVTPCNSQKTYQSLVSQEIRFNVNMRHTLQSNMQELAIKEYCPCFSSEGLTDFIKEVNSLINFLLELYKVQANTNI